MGVAIGHHAGKGSPARHPVAPGIVDDDEIDAARLLALGGKAGARTAADNRLAPPDHLAEMGDKVLALETAHRSAGSPDVISRKDCTSASANCGSLM